jgi:hypothetical protein
MTNPNSSEFRNLVKDQKHKGMYSRAKTKALRYYRHKLSEMVYKDRKNNSIKIFGYWRYWILEGKIGPDE